MIQADIPAGYEACEWKDATAILSDGGRVIEGEVLGRATFSLLQLLGFRPIRKRAPMVWEGKPNVRLRYDEHDGLRHGVIYVPEHFVDKRVRVRVEEALD